MTDYVRLSLGLEASESSDYSNPYLKPPITAYTVSGDLEAEWRKIEAHQTPVAGGTAFVELGNYTTIHSLIIFNPNTTVDVCAVFTNLGGHVGTAAATSHDIGPGKTAIFTDVDPSANLTLDSQSSDTHSVWVGVIGT